MNERPAECHHIDSVNKGDDNGEGEKMTFALLLLLLLTAESAMSKMQRKEEKEREGERGEKKR